MRFAFSDEQEQFRGVVRRFLTDNSPIPEVRRTMAGEPGFDPVLWRRACDELGVVGLQVPEDLGGQGFGFGELGIVMEEAGRALWCAPYLSSAVLATQVLLHGATPDARHALIPDLASGRRRGTLAWTADAHDWRGAARGVRATPSAAGHVLEGRARFVPDGHTADLVIVVADTDDARPALFVVDGAAPGLTRTPRTTIDMTRRFADLAFDGVVARRVSAPGTTTAAVSRALDETAIALACEMVGGARVLLEQAVAYSRFRMQFGRPIGSFQAIKHKCAELLLEVELAGAAAAFAAAAVAEGDPEVPALASLAKSQAADAYLHAAAETIQIHGGIGFTWDHDTHLWYRRAKSSEVWLGDPAAHRERYVAWLEAA